MSLEGKKIVLAVSGGIAAYKSADLAGRLMRAGAEVRVAMTRAACEFIAPLTLEAVTGRPVYRKIFRQPQAHRMEHIEWARDADALIIAPATADLLARLAHGLADDAVTTLYLAFRGPVWVAPAMNTAMWEHPATRENLETLRRRGVRTIGPDAGRLACGDIGWGRMAEPEVIVEALDRALTESAGAPGAAQTLRGERVLITAGPTREPLDPIRFISNRSSGRMGAALARAAAERGAHAILVHGPLQAALPEGVESVPVESAGEMLEAVRERFAACRVAIFAAAVSNYRAAEPARHKIKGGDRIGLELVRNPDIAAWAGAHRTAEQFLVGFAAESENLIEAARKKLSEKNLDAICANPIGVAGVGFTEENNQVVLIEADGECRESGAMPKPKLADWIWDRILDRLTEPTQT